MQNSVAALSMNWRLMHVGSRCSHSSNGLNNGVGVDTMSVVASSLGCWSLVMASITVREAYSDVKSNRLCW